ncbi:uncharacterized protein LOC112597002 [Melanaphis sacchari]|uniref:uncharacterized protein LOC112597002 n=1 Tax=Melanaphis sacchari TaxID=742174 RepID=UPI000DC1443C|nr:uncharacterized protein LOC112597002 [Melanaphis sacchari]
MNILKLFFVFATLTTLAKSEIAVEWICQDIKQMGNCSIIPKITDLLQMISDNYEYPDLYYCPYNIVERYAKCMYSYLFSCHTYMSDLQQTIFTTYNLPVNEDSKMLCTKGRNYRREFIEYASCSKSVLKAEHQWKHFLNNHELEFGYGIEDLEIHQKCLVVNDYWQTTNMHIREKCGFDTEKFHRHVLGNMWPISMILKVCNDLSTYGM